MKVYNKAYYRRKIAENPDWRREQNQANGRRYYKKHRKAILARQRPLRKANRPWISFLHRLQTYKMTLDQFHARSEAQNFCCAICGECVELEIDHCHVSGDVRGLLCSNCNDGLGKFKDSPARLHAAIAYLEKVSKGR